MSVTKFMDQHWQKKPLLVKGAFPSFRPLITQKELIALSNDDLNPSRLVQYHPSNKRWELAIGPFSKNQIAGLPNSNWTILVQDLDKTHESFAKLLDQFNFIPSWRTDDVMVSYATKGGNVGPHIDNYDVFLIQGAGRRRWHIASKPIAEDDFQENQDLRILKNFKADKVYDLEPGDMLYLPPRIGHHGVSLDNDCQTYSIGYRAPRYIDLLQEFISSEENAPSLHNFYTDPKRKTTSEPGFVAPADLKKVFLDMVSLKLNESTFRRWMMRQLSEVKLDTDQESKHSKQKYDFLERALNVKILYTLIDGKPHVYARGEEYKMNKSDVGFCKLLCNERRIDEKTISKLSQSQRKLISTLIKDGTLIPRSQRIKK